jgi:phosphoadenosine phosphosulfate reductase
MTAEQKTMLIEPALAAKVATTLSALTQLSQTHKTVRLAHSLGAEDMVLLDLISSYQLPIEIFTLDTGRLHPLSYELLAKIEQQYSAFPIAVISPNQQATQTLVKLNGINGFYESAQKRKDCCAVRKIEPLKRALVGAQAWVTGLRKEQSDARQTLAIQTFDQPTQLPKLNPLLDWTEQDVWAYITAYQVPTHALHAQGYPSIGCAPCTRAIEPGESIRAGRWWWENEGQKECGLHVGNDGKLVRNKIESNHAH